MGADVLDAPVVVSVLADVDLPEVASPEDATDFREPWERFGYLTIPRVIDTFPDKQRDLARLLLEVAAYRAGRDTRFGTELERGQCATTYADLAGRLGWKTARAAHYHLDCLRETWRAVFGQPLSLTPGRAEGQTTTSRILVITLGGYAKTQQFKSYVNDANVRPKGLSAADNRDSLGPNVRPSAPPTAENHANVRPNVRPPPSQPPIDSTSYSESDDANVRPNVRPTCENPVATMSFNTLTELERNLTKEEEEDSGTARTAGAALKTFSLSKLLEDAETEDPACLYREAKTVYDCAVAGGYIDDEKRPWQMKDSPAEFSPLMNRPHGWRLELLGLLLTTNEYYQDKSVGLGQIKHFIGWGDIYTAATRSGFKRAGLAHLLPEAEKPKRSPATAPAENDWRHLERDGTTGGGFKRACSAGGVLAGALSSASSAEPGDSIEAHERETSQS